MSFKARTRTNRMTGNRIEFRGHRRPQAGFSLIEILVVLILLLVGILAIARLFPGGFFTIRRTAELTQGQALAQQQLDAEKQQFTVPFAVVVQDPTNSQIVDDILPGSLTDQSTASSQKFDPY